MAATEFALSRHRIRRRPGAKTRRLRSSPFYLATYLWQPGAKTRRRRNSLYLATEFRGGQGRKRGGHGIRFDLPPNPGGGRERKRAGRKFAFTGRGIRWRIGAKTAARNSHLLATEFPGGGAKTLPDENSALTRHGIPWRPGAKRAGRNLVLTGRGIRQRRPGAKTRRVEIPLTRHGIPWLQERKRCRPEIRAYSPPNSVAARSENVARDGNSRITRHRNRGGPERKRGRAKILVLLATEFRGGQRAKSGGRKFAFHPPRNSVAARSENTAARNFCTSPPIPRLPGAKTRRLRNSLLLATEVGGGQERKRGCDGIRIYSPPNSAAARSENAAARNSLYLATDSVAARSENAAAAKFAFTRHRIPGGQERKTRRLRNSPFSPPNSVAARSENAATAKFAFFRHRIPWRPGAKTRRPRNSHYATESGGGRERKRGGCEIRFDSPPNRWRPGAKTRQREFAFTRRGIRGGPERKRGCDGIRIYSPPNSVAASARKRAATGIRIYSPPNSAAASSENAAATEFAFTRHRIPWRPRAKTRAAEFAFTRPRISRRPRAKMRPRVIRCISPPNSVAARSGKRRRRNSLYPATEFRGGQDQRRGGCEIRFHSPPNSSVARSENAATAKFALFSPPNSVTARSENPAAAKFAFTRHQNPRAARSENAEGRNSLHLATEFRGGPERKRGGGGIRLISPPNSAAARSENGAATQFAFTRHRIPTRQGRTATSSFRRPSCSRSCPSRPRGGRPRGASGSGIRGKTPVIWRAGPPGRPRGTSRSGIPGKTPGIWRAGPPGRPRGASRSGIPGKNARISACAGRGGQVGLEFGAKSSESGVRPAAGASGSGIRGKTLGI